MTQTNATPAAPASSTTPQPFGKPPSSRSSLRLLCRLGQGGMAEVHLASAATLDGGSELLVVKRMHAQHLEDAASVRMFLDEGRLALRLSHPNIVRAQRLGMFDGRHGIVMEYLDGQPLQHVLKRAYELEHSLSLEVTAQIAIAALDGLHYAHELKDGLGRELCVVHRDVSPQNLFVTYDGAVKLLDFGIAKNAMQDARTRTGLLKGKISYMAPEQARGESIDRRADIWSLGVMLWEAVTGSRLFKGANEAASLNLTLTEEVVSPSTRRDDLPLELEAILMRALRRDPAERYASAAAMRDELEAWLVSRELDASASVPQLMQRLFAGEMAAQRAQVQQLLQASHEPRESGVTLVAPALSFSSGTLSGLRATPMSSVTDLMEELTRQRKITTRLLSALVVMTVIAGLLKVYALIRPAQEPSPAPVSALPAPIAGSAASGAAPAARFASAAATAPAPIAVAQLASVPAPTAASVPAAAPGRRAAASKLRQPATATEPAPQELGFLSLDTSPWSNVSVGGKLLGQTPIVHVALPVGVHSLSLTNPEQGLRTTYEVTISAGRTTARRVGLD
jgi:serine/threonine protein kinase